MLGSDLPITKRAVSQLHYSSKRIGEINTLRRPCALTFCRIDMKRFDFAIFSGCPVSYRQDVYVLSRSTAVKRQLVPVSLSCARHSLS